MDISIWKLADDTDFYGVNAGKFIAVTPDGEDEPYAPAIFDTADELRAFAEKCGDMVVPIIT